MQVAHATSVRAALGERRLAGQAKGCGDVHGEAMHESFVCNVA